MTVGAELYFGDSVAGYGELPEDVTAIAALSDTLAFRALAMVADLGRAWSDYAVIGFGDSVEAALWRPSLTSVDVDSRGYGVRTACELLGLPVANRPAPAQIKERFSTSSFSR